MNQELYHYLQARPELMNFIRQNPYWYRYLTRDPSRVVEMEKEAKRFYGKTFTQKMDKMNQNIQMVGVLLQFAEMMKD
ncbi:YlbE-like family protein [Ornithinibacillus contaminans]|uniref:YlbE-like family protein n=1 Tax=Ornithinibacillus contaminans TaxID=694055 RepID=UPI00064D96F2|nr:YlbE-like family protein [Ornithinibacillus contaminans]